MNERHGNFRGRAVKGISAFLLLVMLISASAAALSSCGDDVGTKAPVTEAEPVVTSAAEPETTAGEEPENEPEDEEEVEPMQLPDDEVGEEVTEEEVDLEPDVDILPDEQDNTAADAEQETTAEETQEETTEAPAGQHPADGNGINPLTGIYTGKDYTNKRPVAIMINNLKASLPQIGISQNDILYECLVEGGTTRLLMVKMDYEDLGVIGSVRSSRDYYIDFAQNHDAIYVHAGGSNDAYSAIQSRAINNLDGVNMYLPSTFYRDEERRKTMSVEHTLMTTGEGIVSGIQYKHYRTTLRSGFASPFTFAAENEKVSNADGQVAKHVIITYNSYQFPQYIYSSKTGLYKRYQFNGDPHIDGQTGETLTFKNIIVLVCDHSALHDEKNHIAVDTTGSGKGYYITNGRAVDIRWSKADRDANLVLTLTDGSPLVMNAGNTMVNIVSPGVYSNMYLNYTEK